MRDKHGRSPKLFEFIAWRSHKGACGRLSLFLIVLGLTMAVLFSHSACIPPLPPTCTPTCWKVTRTPISSPTLTVSPTPTPTLLPPVALEAPGDGECLACRSDISFRWNWFYELREDQYFQLKVKGQDSSGYSSLFYHKWDCLTRLAPSPGEYNWTVTVVRSTGEDDYVPLSEESEWRSFRILPSPVVHSIFPTSTVQGTSGVTVTVSGENFTHSVALTIGVPLQAAFVNSSTITATIPITLEVGEYDVTVKDSFGQGYSSASFTVSEPPTPTPVPTPVYPPPELIRLDIIQCSITFYWSWAGELDEDEYFAVRFGVGDPGDSKTWTKETQYSDVLTRAGEYVWEVAICRGDPDTHICEQLAVSEQQVFEFRGCGGGEIPP